MLSTPHGDLILGIETSCDETAVAVVRAGHQLLSNVISSQIATHAPYGGVVPEIASREHLRHVVPVTRQALQEAGVGLQDISAIAVTEGPGLAGALMVGICYAKALAYAAGKPLLAVNHLEGHIHSSLLAATQQDAVTLPALALVVSGGHTHLFLAKKNGVTWTYQNIGRTVDDAAGEAFDKVGKMLGLGYPGGPWVAALAEFGNPLAISFGFPQVKAKVHLRKNAGTEGARQNPTPDWTLFSFSGIKTAVRRHMELHAMSEAAEARRQAIASGGIITPQHLLPMCDEATLDLLASFQHAVVEDLVRKTLRAAERFEATVLVSGGVAANSQLRLRFSQETAALGLTLAFPDRGMSTDNAAMIAAAAWPKFINGEFAAATLSAQPNLRL